MLPQNVTELQTSVVLQEHDVADPNEIIFVMTKEERKNFYRTVSKGLNRTLFSVYRRVLRMYDPTNHVGKYSPDELKRLKESVVTEACQSECLGSALTCISHCFQVTAGVRQGLGSDRSCDGSQSVVGQGQMSSAARFLQNRFARLHFLSSLRNNLFCLCRKVAS